MSNSVFQIVCVLFRIQKLFSVIIWWRNNLYNVWSKNRTWKAPVRTCIRIQCAKQNALIISSIRNSVY